MSRTRPCRSQRPRAPFCALPRGRSPSPPALFSRRASSLTSGFCLDRMIILYAKKAFFQRLFVKCGFCLAADVCECGSIRDGKVCKDLAVEVDTCNLEPVHQLGIGKSIFACACIDTRDPQAAHIALTAFSADVRVVEGLHDRFACDAVVLALAAEIALCEL